MIAYIAWLGAAISMYGTVRYIIGIMKDGTEPRLASWIAWFIANAAMMFMAFINGAQDAAIFNALSAAGNAGVLIIAAVKRTGQKPSGAVDWTCLAVAGVCSVTNAAFPQLAMVGVLLAMFANLVATWPTMSHAWREPHAETWQLFAANAGASLLGVIGVSASGGFTITTIAGPLVAMIGNITLTSIVLSRRYGPTVANEVVALEQEVASEVVQLEHTVLDAGARVGEELTHVAENVSAAAKAPARKKVAMLGSQAGA